MALDLDVAHVVTDRLTYITVAAEDIWARDPFLASGSGSGLQNAVHLPVDNYDVRFKPERRQAVPRTGLMTKKHGTLFRGMLSGTLACPLYGYVPEGLGKSMAQMIFEWALGTTGGATNDEQGKELPSKTVRFSDGGISNKAHYGLRCNQFTLSGSDDNGGIAASLDLMGKNEAGDVSVAAIPNNHHRLVDFDFQLSVFKIAGVQVPAKQFQFVAGNELAAAFNAEQTPNLIVKTNRTYQLQLNLLKRGSTYEAMARALGMNEFTVQIVLKGLHDGTAAGTYTTCTIDMDRVQFIDDEPQKGTIWYEQLNLEPLKPDTSNRAVRFTWGTE